MTFEKYNLYLPIPPCSHSTAIHGKIEFHACPTQPTIVLRKGLNGQRDYRRRQRSGGGGRSGSGDGGGGELQLQVYNVDFNLINDLLTTVSTRARQTHIQSVVIRILCVYRRALMMSSALLWSCICYNII